MNFSAHPPSKQWAPLKYRGEKIAQVWFKPEGEPFALTFRIPRKSFEIPGMAQQLTAENLLKAVAIARGEVASFGYGEVRHAGLNGANLEFGNPFPLPPPDDTHLDILVRLIPPAGEAVSPEEAAPAEKTGESGTEETRTLDEPTGVQPSLPPAPENGTSEVFPEFWDDLGARWKAILALEATVDTLRIGMQGLLTEMEASLRKTLTTEEKIHALRVDLAQWEKAKSRVHYALPRVKEFIHRATWAIGAPERKQLGEIHKNHIQPQIPFPGMTRVLDQLENLQKDRQILSAQGVTVYQECKNIAAAVQGALSTLQNNAARNAKKKGASGGKGKFFKDIRRWTGAE